MELAVKQLEKAREEGDKMVFEILEAVKELRNILYELPEESRDIVAKYLQDIVAAAGKQDVVSQRLDRVKKFLLTGDNEIDMQWRLDEGRVVSQSDVDKLFS
ncbi:hypothetical protein SAMN06265340_11339 [Desulfurobacterium atlanticum]|uniref:Uncharacterized protein n=2 Tax=Desulfurobacterium atlanticum TaxID=240169 RepID=A0A238ZYI0_9BACT|nr:hypothetical protein SAMN06265340_11339 [Desulfurobacterium atlanticum]